MFREVVAPRPDWTTKAEEVGFTYHSAGKTAAESDGVYWYEGACYRFTLREIEAIERATEEMHRICMLAVNHVVETPGMMDRFAIPEDYHEYIRRSWRRRDPHLMGRFDITFNPRSGAIKMLEYNADTPTLVIETAVVQWHWMNDVRAGKDQFNSLHERLIERFAEIAERLPAGATMHFASLGNKPREDGREWSEEEFQHATYFRDLATQAGILTQWIDINDIDYDPNIGFFDTLERPIKFLHKLYPWEWMATEAFSKYALEDRTGFVEPVWKMLLSNKAILTVLWEMFPRHPNLLATYLNADNPVVKFGQFVEKPILAREGANIRLVRRGESEVRTAGTYGDSPTVFQEFSELTQFEGQNVVIGSWIVGDAAAGMIVRESASPIVVNSSRVVPHYFIENF